MPNDTSRLLDERALPSQPFELFSTWFDAAVAAQIPDPNAMTLATATPEGIPSARIVLLRGHDERGFAFFTNYQSRKGDELAANPHATLVFFWAALERQVRVEGRVEKVSARESDVYFQNRPRGHQLGAHASPQSQVIASRELLESRLAEVIAKIGDGPVPRPAHWGGYRVIPSVVEFWQGQTDRLHDRVRYRRQETGWTIERLAP